MANGNLPAKNEFYKSTEFVASVIVLFIFLFDFVPFFNWHFFLIERHLSGLSTLEMFTEFVSFIYYLFYLVPIAAAYLAIRTFLREGPATAFALPARYIVFGGLTLFMVFRVIGLGEMDAGLSGLGFGFFVAWIASWFLPFEEQLIALMAKLRQRAQQS